MITNSTEVSKVLELDCSYGDWAEVFKYAEGPRYALPDRVADDRFWQSPIAGESPGFTREDVAVITDYRNGDNDGPDWIMLGQLKDDRWFFVYAGCDYTGWGRQKGGGSYVAGELDTLTRFVLTNEDRERFGMSLDRENETS